ncbi:Formimidoyltetrahydrofolate cyclodeaminase [Caldanaerovirga acetigignens]|uniref:Formimidoyltetrahydrofolate cyclodeaminase n=1 Tax=Caldanaerovirga acetigignens TaxID=447595 RepID=A0A1M7GXV1_9FIRM|nr:cyclodeaminase/cyclohydrolase family protein [Caldanaerovirga acetigignens]SHM21008.1 Formimidoyltetrahydrofolate cyclodeaminase [Caldanaerovirga acetigignens]
MFVKSSLEDFVEVLSSKDPVPGGGGAAGLAGALGSALGGMVCNLTIGKEKYKDVEPEITDILEKLKDLQRKLLLLVDEDAEVFKEVAAAYKLPKNTEEEKQRKKEALNKALKNACQVPLKIMEYSLEALKLQRRLAKIGSKMAISDVGVGALLLKAAVHGGKLNVLINLGGLDDKEFVGDMKKYIDDISKEADILAEEAYKEVLGKL